MTNQTMTRSRWLQRVADNAEALRSLIANYHPSAGKRAPKMPITAHNAEVACENVRQKIATEQPTDPVKRWDVAVANGDISTLDSLLNDAWFGVPESTQCWEIPGFSVAVDLMDDPPEEGEI